MNARIALAVAQLVKERNKVFLASGPATTDLTGKACTPNTVHWTYDTYALAHTTGSAEVQSGGDTRFFLTADYAFGAALERDTADVVKASGGKVLGSVKHPLNTTDFSSFLLQAQASKAKVIGLANAGGDTINSIKAASEFGIVKGGQRLAGLLVFANDVRCRRRRGFWSRRASTGTATTRPAPGRRSGRTGWTGRCRRWCTRECTRRCSIT